MRPFILNQGRCRFLNPYDVDDELDEEQLDEITALGLVRPEPVVTPKEFLIEKDSPGAMSSVNEDSPILIYKQYEGTELAQAPFTVRVCYPTCAVSNAVRVNSQRWPGLVSLSDDVFCKSFYLGQADKYDVERTAAVKVMVPKYSEFKDEEILEYEDPSAEQEEEFMMSHVAPVSVSEDEFEDEEGSTDEDGSFGGSD